jgi:ATP-dependent DNA helicase DinG
VPDSDVSATAEPTDPSVRRTLAALDRVTSELPGGETRDGQREMAAAVAAALKERRHLVVQAGTGTGKSLAYLVPAIVAGRKTVIATATKALQDQLAGKDLPFLGTHLDLDVSWAMLKGRSNYVCRQRLREIAKGGEEQLALDGLAERASAAELAELAAWADDSPTGDRAELPREPSAAAWAAVSVSARECPGATRCPSGGVCFAEAARTAAAEASLVVVNQHLYGLHVASGGVLLPEHDVVVIDEAHAFEDVVSATAGLDIAASRFTTLARATRSILDDQPLNDGLEAVAARWDRALAPEVGRRLKGGLGADLGDLVALAVERTDRALAELRAIDPGTNADAGARKQRAVQLAGSLLEELHLLAAPGPTNVLWIEGPETRPSLRLAPLDVAALLSEGAWPNVTAVLTSATVPPGLDHAVGLPHDRLVDLDVGSPFDYEQQALLFCAASLPDPRQPGFDEAVHEELHALIGAAGGRTLALFTSFRAMDAAAEALRGRVDHPILTQRERPKPALLAEFAADPATCLFATMGFWQGVDVPGPSLSLVTIDRLPFPRPDEPLLQARRELAREAAFRTVDLPRAVTLMAQGVGRLIRSTEDRGVVAVLDPRLATSKSYRWDIVRALPPMRRTRDRAEAEKFLRDLRL